MHEEGSDSLEDLCLGKLKVRCTEKLTLNITSTWACVVSKMKRDKGAGTYYETPVMPATGEWRRAQEMELEHTKRCYLTSAAGNNT